VYIAEAHAQDQWPLGRHVFVYSHKKIEDRLEIANRYVKTMDYKLPMYVDTMNNTFMNTWWCHPERYFLFYKGKVVMKAQPEDDGWYSFDVLREKLEELRKQIGKTETDLEDKH